MSRRPPGPPVAPPRPVPPLRAPYKPSGVISTSPDVWERHIGWTASLNEAARPMTIERLRDRYVYGKIELDEFEQGVGRLLGLAVD